MPSKQAPPHLRPRTRAWWRAVIVGYELEAHHVHLLTLAAEQLDRAAEARERLSQEGAYLTDRFGQLRLHPAVQVERDASMTYAKLMRELDLDAAVSEPRPPELRRWRHAAAS